MTVASVNDQLTGIKVTLDDFDPCGFIVCAAQTQVQRRPLLGTAVLVASALVSGLAACVPATPTSLSTRVLQILRPSLKRHPH
jgi:hypothetical protein